MTDPTAPPVLSRPEGSFGYCAVCYHPLDKCSHCDADVVARLTAENEALRLYRADVVSWADMLRGLRDRLQKGAENIDAALIAIEYDPAPNCPTCGALLGGSFPTCASCQLVEALKRGE
jgi:hypothetical protein